MAHTASMVSEEGGLVGGILFQKNVGFEVLYPPLIYQYPTKDVWDGMGETEHSEE